MERGSECTHLALPSSTSFGWSWEWDLVDVSHVSATGSTWACWSRRLTGCSAQGRLLAELENLLGCLLQSLPLRLLVICQNFVRGRPLLNRILSGQLGDQGSVTFPRPLHLCLRPPCSLSGEQTPHYLQRYCAMCPPTGWITPYSLFSLSLFSLCRGIIPIFFVCRLSPFRFYFLDVIERAEKNSQPGVLMGKGGRK